MWGTPLYHSMILMDTMDWQREQFKNRVSQTTISFSYSIQIARGSEKYLLMLFQVFEQDKFFSS